MSKRIGVGCLIALLLLGSSGCYGPFQLTQNLHAWNGQVGEKWANEVVFLVLIWVPVYGLATLADGLIFNAIEFWTGDNPIQPTALDSSQPRTKRVAGRNSEARLALLSDKAGERFVIQQFQNGKEGERLTIQRRGDTTVAMNAKGEVLYAAHTRPDGSVVITNADGREIASRSREEIRQYAKTVSS